ncbi:MAG TPA: PAS domain S-box protein [Terriglobales bacterium]|nr:PAS domain S-box protein [Terriglobales bacterium]
MPNYDYPQVSFSLAKIMGEAETPAQFFPEVLALLAESFDWQFGALWRVDYDNLQIVNVGTWTRPGWRFPQFEAVTRLRGFHIGQGLPGSIWQERQARWIEELGPNENFPRLPIAVKEGLRSGVGFPVRVGKQTLGMVELYRTEPSPLDEPMLDFFRLVGGQLGLFLERIRADEGITSSEAQYRLLVEKAIDPIVTIDENSNIIFANHEMEKLFGYSAGELITARLTIIIPERLRERHEAGMRRYIAEGKRNLSWDGVVLPAVHKDGTEFNVQIRFGEFYRGTRRLFSGYIRKVD